MTASLIFSIREPFSLLVLYALYFRMHLHGLVVPQTNTATPRKCLDSDLNGRASANWLAARWLSKLTGTIGGHSFAKCSLRDRFCGLHCIIS